MERVFQIAAVVFIAAAAVFFLLDNIDGVFISIVLGCLSFFLSVRTQVKGRLAIRDAEIEAEYQRSLLEEAEDQPGSDLRDASEPAFQDEIQGERR